MRVFVEDVQVRVPGWVVDLESFRRWSDDDAFPETGKISFLDDEVWIDMGKEQLFSHNQVKMAVAYAVMRFLLEKNEGRYFGDGAFLSNTKANISNQPDGMFVLTSSFQQGRVRVVEGRTNGHVELEGTPDMVLEVVSDSSEEKDTHTLREAYARARIPEYWLIDARNGVLHFDILRLNRAGKYVTTRKVSGWVRSDVFDRWFRLDRQTGPDGFPDFTLGVQNERPTA